LPEEVEDKANGNEDGGEAKRDARRKSGLMCCLALVLNAKKSRRRIRHSSAKTSMMLL